MINVKKFLLFIYRKYTCLSIESASFISELASSDNVSVDIVVVVFVGLFSCFFISVIEVDCGRFEVAVGSI